MLSLILLDVPRMHQFAFSNTILLGENQLLCRPLYLTSAKPLYSDNSNYVTLVEFL
jgi:hypothetical protein